MAITGALQFRPAYTDVTGTPVAHHYAAKSGETFIAGTPVKISAGEVMELGSTDVTLIVGVAGAGVSTAMGYNLANSPTVVTGRTNTVPVFTATRSTIFYGQLSNGTTALIAPIAAYVDGVGFGVVKQTDGRWTVNQADTTNKVVQITGFDTTVDSPGRVYFKFFAAAVAP